MKHEKFVYWVMLGKHISELLRESNNKQMYADFFAENNKYYELDNLSMYDVYELSVIAINNGNDLVDKNYDHVNEISSFLAFCHLFIDEMENLKHDI